MKHSYLLFVLSILFCCCKKDSPPVEATTKEFSIYVDYWNSDGESPEISFDPSNSDSEIKIDFEETFGGEVIPPNLVDVIIDNLRIIDELNRNYEIDSINAYEYQEGYNTWREDVEFTMDYSSVESMDVVLVLDASDSLGNDLETVKTYAVNFIEKMYTEIPSVNVGVISFTDSINISPLTQDSTEVISFVENIEQGQYSRLYEAASVGVELLQASDSEGKALLIFSDGVDNFSSQGYTQASLLQELNTSTDDLVKINSFTIGLEGEGIKDNTVLTNMATNGGFAAFPESVDELDTVFEAFSRSIPNVYNLTYTRNKQIVSQDAAIRLKFVITGTLK